MWNKRQIQWTKHTIYCKYNPIRVTASFTCERSLFFFCFCFTCIPNAMRGSFGPLRSPHSSLILFGMLCIWQDTHHSCVPQKKCYVQEISKPHISKLSQKYFLLNKYFRTSVYAKMAAARFSSEALRMFFGPINREETRNLSQVEQNLSVAIQNLPPELRERIIKEVLTLEIREREALGWNEIHYDLLYAPVSEI